MGQFNFRQSNCVGVEDEGVVDADVLSEAAVLEVADLDGVDGTAMVKRKVK